MSRKSRVLIAVTAAVLVLPPTIWFLTRPKIPIEFVGTKAPFEFLFPDDFKGKPLIDVTIPGGMQIAWPSKRKLVYGTEDEFLCGYLVGEAGWLGEDWYFRRGTDYIEGGISMMVDPSARSKSAPPAPGPGGIRVAIRGPSGIALLDVPYAIDEKYRQVTLVKGKKTWDVRLPVSNRWGPAVRKPTSFQSGPWTVQARFEPWCYSTAMIDLRLTSNAPRTTKILLDFTWQDNSGRFAWDRSRTWMIENGQETIVPLPRHIDARVAIGTAFELIPEPLRLTATLSKKDGLNLALPNGKVIYGKHSQHMLEHHGYKGISCRGKWISTKGRVFRSALEPLTFTEIQHGDVIEAIGYRVKSKTPLRMELDVPPPLKSNRQGVYVGGISGSIVYRPRDLGDDL